MESPSWQQVVILVALFVVVGFAFMVYHAGWPWKRDDDE